MRGRGGFGRHGGGVHHSNFHHGHHHHNTVSQQPLHMRYDFDWESKPSTNGEFKYGLLQCCCGPTAVNTVVCFFICSVLIFPGWILLAKANGELGEIIGTNLDLIKFCKIHLI